MPIMTSHIPKIDVLSGPERRRCWSTTEKLAIVQETYEPDVTVSIVARRHGIQPNQFGWRARSTGCADCHCLQEEVVPVSEYRALQNQVKELQRLVGKKTMEGDGRRNPQGCARYSIRVKKHLLRSLSLPKDGSR